MKDRLIKKFEDEIHALDRFTQRLAWCEQLFLPDELVERARPHPLGERGGRGLAAGRVVRKQRVHVVDVLHTR